MKRIAVIVLLILMGTFSPPRPARAFYVPLAYPSMISPAMNGLPEGYVTINAGEETFYYCNGVFYQKIMRDQKYVVVAPPVGVIVYSIPAGYQYLVVNDAYYYIYHGVYYKRVLEGYRVVLPPA